MKTTVFLLIWIIPIALNVFADSDGRKPNYLQMLVLRGIAAFLHWCLFVNSPDQMVLLFWLFVFEVTSYWLVFEAWLNIVRRKPILYYDTTENDSGWIDRVFAWAGYRWHKAAKVTTLVVMVYSIIRVYDLA